MKKLSVILVLSLILLTALIKNSTKRIDDKIFAIEESIRILKKDYENTKLEFDYLSSAKKLDEFMKLYFNEELINKRAQLFKQRNIDYKKLEEKDFKNLLLEHYTFIKRPILIYDEKIFVGNSTKTILKAIKFLNEQ